MKMQMEHEGIILGLLEKTDNNVKVMIIESIGYINAVREIMPNADITVVSTDSLVDKGVYDGLEIKWIHENYLNNILTVDSESFDVILGDNLFFKSCDPLRTALSFCTYLSETGYLVTSFYNYLYWKIVVDMMKGIAPKDFDRLFTDKDMSEVLHNAYFRDVNFTPLRDHTDAGKTNIERLASMSNDITSEVLSIKAWCVKATKFKPNQMAFKRRYSKKTRWDLAKRLHRIEYGIGVKENTIEVLHLIDSEVMRLSDVAVYIYNHADHIGEFISNFVPEFYQSNRVGLLRELLSIMGKVYQGHADYDTIIEWKECIDALDEYPDELLPKSSPKLPARHDHLNIAPENKVAFIACVNNEEWYHEWQLYINNLIVPEGMIIELVPVRGAKSICQGYNMGMRQTDAKYKVYLHQDVLIVNKNIIEDMLKIFNDNSIGALGVIGARTLPSTGVWWESNDRVGRAIEVNDPECIIKYDYPPFSGEYINVQAFDGILIATQVDIAWREDVFTGWHFYDVSQCQEMRRHGYRVVVPQQNDYWVIHCSAPKKLDDSYEEYRNLFVSEYIQETKKTNNHETAKKFLVIGNSFAQHEKCSYWWGKWGMAASRKEADYVHLIAKKLSVDSPIIPEVFNFSVWEMQSYDRHETLQLLNKFDFNSYEFIIVQLGENVHDTSDVINDYYELLSYIREKASPNKRIFVYGNLWSNDISDEEKEKICKLVSAEYISVKPIQNERFLSGMNRIVLGDDGAEHIIEHAGAALHPNDEAMKFYADELIKRLLK